jgi:hypothetical protein
MKRQIKVKDLVSEGIDIYDKKIIRKTELD